MSELTLSRQEEAGTGGRGLGYRCGSHEPWAIAAATEVNEFLIQEEYLKERAFGRPLMMWQAEKLVPIKGRVRAYFKS